MSSATILFASGASIEVDVDEISVSRSRFDGDIVSIEWHMPDGARRRLTSINTKNIDAVVFNDDTAGKNDTERETE